MEEWPDAIAHEDQFRRLQAFKQRSHRDPKVFWLFGLSGAGKTTIATAVVERLRAAQINVSHLDGDVLRSGLCRGLGFSAEDRLENVRRAAEVAKLMTQQGNVTICSLITPLEAHREQARSILQESFVDVYVRCELEECIRRDPKGLYAKAQAGTIPSFTGVGSPYEVPSSPQLTLDTQANDRESCINQLIQFITQDGPR